MREGEESGEKGARGERKTHYVILWDKSSHYLLPPQLGAVDVLFDLLPHSGHHLLVVAVHLSKHDVAGETRSPYHVLDTGTHCNPLVVLLV